MRVWRVDPVDLSSFLTFSLAFFIFHDSALVWLWIRLHDLIFLFSIRLSSLMLRLSVLRVNLGRLKLFHCVLFFNWFFLHFQHLTMSLLKIRLHNLFSFLLMGLSQYHDLGRRFDRLIRVKSSYFFIYFSWGYLDIMTRVTGLAG